MDTPPRENIRTEGDNNPEEVPLNTSVLSGASTTEEIVLNTTEQDDPRRPDEDTPAQIGSLGASDTGWSNQGGLQDR